jgi:hypothetical protein
MNQDNFNVPNNLQRSQLSLNNNNEKSYTFFNERNFIFII